MTTTEEPPDPLSRAALALREHATPPPKKNSTTTPRKRTSARRNNGNHDHPPPSGPQQSPFFSRIALPSAALFTPPPTSSSNSRGVLLASSGAAANRTGDDTHSTAPTRSSSHCGGNGSVQLLQAPNTYERNLCEKLDLDFERVYMEHEIGYQARLKSVRQIAASTFLIFALYLILGCLYYSVLSTETRWPVEESLIFLIYTVTTVGYGNHDIPTSPGSRVFLIFFILIGIALVTLVFSEAFQYMVLEAARAKYVLDEDELRQRGIETSNRQQELMREEDRDEETQNQINFNKNSNNKSATVTSTMWKKSLSRCLFTSHAQVKRYLQASKLGQVCAILLPFIGLLLLGATVVGVLEGWSAIDSLYWAVVTLTTVGYGDLAPTKKSTIWFCICYLPTATIFLSLFLSHVAQLYLQFHILQISRIEKELRKQQNMLDNSDDIHCGQNLFKSFTKETSSSSDDGQSSPLFTKKSPSKELSRDRGQESDDADADADADQHNATSGTSHRPTLSKGTDSLSMRDVLTTTKKAKMQHILSQDPSTKRHVSERPHYYEGISSASVQPSLLLRTKVQERLAFIIAEDLCKSPPSHIDISPEGGFTVTFPTWKLVQEKWLIPKKAKDAFRSVAFELLLLAGLQDVKTRGLDALLDLNSDDFQRLFNPVLAAMGSAECMEAWMLSTNHFLELNENTTY